MAAIPHTSGWTSYWEAVTDKRIFAIEARDHVDRLRRVVDLHPGMRVLDFGCGFGHVAQQLAPLVGHVACWDAAETMREATAARTAGPSNVTILDLSEGVPPEAAGSFDLVLATSVIQYMVPAELGRWLAHWAALLRPQGRAVISDVPYPNISAVREVVGMLRFAARHGFLLRAFRDAVLELRHYAEFRGRLDIERWTPAELDRIATGAGLVPHLLPGNLTHRTGRFTMLLEKRSPGPGSG